MKYSKIPVARSIVALCEAKGVNHVVISPGSRNAPLTYGFAMNENIKTYSIVDERCAAFVALGMAQRLRQPVAVLCTSGSALLNYYPAVAEAFYSDIPLIVISADRPIERIDIGDGQTIRQKNVFENHILYSASLYSEAVPENEVKDRKLQQKQYESQKHNEREINLALNTAIEGKGPVHINVPFYEPLYELVDQVQDRPLQILPEDRRKIYSREQLFSYAQIWNKAQRKLVLVGVQPPNALQDEFLRFLAEDPSVIVFTETTSNLNHPEFFTRIDTVIGPIEADENPEELFLKLQPDILLTFGGMVVSKKIKAFLRKYRPDQHWHIDSKKAYNTFFCLNKHFDTEPNDFFNQFVPLVEPVQSNYAAFWQGIRTQRQQKHELYMSRIPYSDLKVMQILVPKVPAGNILHIANSSCIRYAQLFKWKEDLSIYCNRGTSGIDGSISTSIGAAMASAQPVLMLTGDLSFFYDSNSLWNQYIPPSFRMIILNNQGGGIFRILPGNKDTDIFDTYFETIHDLQAKQICEMHKLEYFSASSEESLTEALDTFFTPGSRARVLEVFTPRKVNDKVLLEYFNFMKTEKKTY